MRIKRFQENLLNWFDHFGRKDLPWQQNKSGYSVWVSEIMLQQTQVNTVIPYFKRFMARFPNLTALAVAHQEDVLHLWTGLGYYARARNLHKAAQLIQANRDGQFPDSLDELIALPGIGRSTAAAILSLAYGQHHAILDGNVKRILCRFFGIAGWPGDPAIMSELWSRAEQVTPQKRCADFNQAMMDLGASLCSRTKPSCQQCPLQVDCKAYLLDRTAQYPTPKPKRALPERATYCLMLTHPVQGVLLEKRPDQGIWGGLWVFPEFSTITEVEEWLKQQAIETGALSLWPTFRHTFTHFHLHINPVFTAATKQNDINNIDAVQYCWHQQYKTLGLPAPILTLLKKLEIG